MENILLEATDKTPRIEGDLEKGTFSIEGRCLPENAKIFYTPILDWLELLSDSKAELIRVDLAIEYYNTSTSKVLLEIFKRFKDLSDTKNVEMYWHYEDDDIEMMEIGENFRDLVGDFVHVQSNLANN